MTTATPATTVRTRTAKAPGTTFGGAVWIVIIAIVPIHRLLMVYVTAQLTYLILAVVVMCALLGRMRVPSAAWVWVMALISIPLASIIAGTSSSVLQSAYVGIKLGLLVGLTPFIIRYYSLERQSFTRYALTGFLAVQSMSAAVGLAQLAGASVAGLRANAGRANGLAIHPNVLGIMAAIAILVSFVLIHQTTGRIRLLAWGVIILNVAALIGSGSLSSMLSLAAGAVVLLVAMRATTRTVIRTCAAVVMCSALALTLGYNPSAAIDPIEGRVNTVLGLSNDGVASLSIRESTYEFAIDSIRSDPLIGVGMDSMHEGTFNGVTVVHNYLLRAWYQGGLLLFVTFLIVTIAMLGLACRSMISTRDGLQAAVITAVIVFGLTSAFYDQQQYWLPLLFAVAVTNRPTVQSTAPGGRLTSRAPRAVEKSKEEIRS
ncbi:hypothetical protein A4U94_07810 [Prescottella equi]|nr:hypothetical protein A4U94_07810 [Prescottella equi]